MSNKSISISPIKVVGHGQDELGRWHVQLAVQKKKLEPISLESVSREPRSLFALLNNAGVCVLKTSTKGSILEAIESKPMVKQFDVAARMGLHNDYFVLPSEVLGKRSVKVERALGYLDEPLRQKYRSQGTLKGWQKAILPLCEGNSRLMFSVCFALASVVAAVIDAPQKNGGFQLFGEPETGKTTAVTVAGTVWGRHQGATANTGFCESWNTTSNKLEQVICAHTHVGLLLDETALFEGNHGEVIMRLAEGASKARMNQPDALRFQGFFMSTSNKPVWAMVPHGSGQTKEAVLSRMTDIPLPEQGQGIYERLHGFPDGAALSDAFKTASGQHFGCAGPAFVAACLAELADTSSRVKMLKFIDERRKWYARAIRTAAEEQGLRVLQRPADRFASVYAAGRLAEQLGVLPWPRKPMGQAVLACHLDALKAVQPFLNKPSAAYVSPREGLKRLQTYVRENRSQFVNLDKRPLDRTKQPFGKAVGYAASFNDQKWFYFEASQFKQIVGGESTAYGLIDWLRTKSLIARSAKAITIQRPVYAEGKGNKKHVRVVAVRRRVMKEVA